MHPAFMETLVDQRSTDLRNRAFAAEQARLARRARSARRQRAQAARATGSPRRGLGALSAMARTGSSHPRPAR